MDNVNQPQQPAQPKQPAVAKQNIPQPQTNSQMSSMVKQPAKPVQQPIKANPKDVYAGKLKAEIQSNKDNPLQKPQMTAKELSDKLDAKEQKIKTFSDKSLDKLKQNPKPKEETIDLVSEGYEKNPLTEHPEFWRQLFKKHGVDLKDAGITDVKIKQDPTDDLMDYVNLIDKYNAFAEKEHKKKKANLMDKYEESVAREKEENEGISTKDWIANQKEKDINEILNSDKSDADKLKAIYERDDITETEKQIIANKIKGTLKGYGQSIVKSNSGKIIYNAINQYDLSKMKMQDIEEKHKNLETQKDEIPSEEYYYLDEMFKNIKKEKQERIQKETPNTIKDAELAIKNYIVKNPSNNKWPEILEFAKEEFENYKKNGFDGNTQDMIKEIVDKYTALNKNLNNLFGV